MPASRRLQRSAPRLQRPTPDGFTYLVPRGSAAHGNELPLQSLRTPTGARV
jgi:hypothetical protein